MGYKEISLISIMFLSLAYILPNNFFIMVALVISCIVLYQTFQDSKQGHKEYKVWTSLSLLVIFTVVSVFIFYKPVLAICSIIFYVLQISIYTVNKNQPHTEEAELENDKDIEKETKKHTISVNIKDLKTLVQDEVSDQLSKSPEIQEIIERERIATENIELHKRKVVDMEKTLQIQKNVSDNEIIKLRHEKEEYQKRTEETQKEALQAQAETSKLYQEMQRKIQESAYKEQQAHESIEEYERKIADIEKELETQKNMSNSEMQKLQQKKEVYQIRLEETQKEALQAQEINSKLHQEMQQKVQESADKEQQAQKKAEHYKKRLSDIEKELENQKELSKEQMEKSEKEIKELRELIESKEEEALKVQREMEQLIEVLSEQLNITEAELQKFKKIATQKTEKGAKELEERWEMLFPKLLFAPGVIKYVYKHFKNNERNNVEKVLIDISGAVDPHTLRTNLKKIHVSEDGHIRFSIPSYSDCRVFYQPNKGNANEKKVLITQITKQHNDAHYGK